MRSGRTSTERTHEPVSSAETEMLPPTGLGDSTRPSICRLATLGGRRKIPRSSAWLIARLIGDASGDPPYILNPNGAESVTTWSKRQRGGPKLAAGLGFDPDF